MSKYVSQAVKEARQAEREDEMQRMTNKIPISLREFRKKLKKNLKDMSMEALREKWDWLSEWVNQDVWNTHCFMLASPQDKKDWIKKMYFTPQGRQNVRESSHKWIDEMDLETLRSTVAFFCYETFFWGRPMEIDRVYYLLDRSE